MNMEIKIDEVQLADAIVTLYQKYLSRFEEWREDTKREGEPSFEDFMQFLMDYRQYE